MIRVLIERRCKEGKEHALENLIMDLRGRSLHQPGYISGETLVELKDPRSFLVISNWSRSEAWRAWENSRARLEIVDLMTPLLAEEPRCQIYGSPLESEETVRATARFEYTNSGTFVN